MTIVFNVTRTYGLKPFQAFKEDFNEENCTGGNGLLMSLSLRPTSIEFWHAMTGNNANALRLLRQFQRYQIDSQ